MIPAVLLILVLAAAPASAQEPRLPAVVYPNASLESLDALLKGPGASIPIEASVLRARLLARSGRFDESAQAWQDVAAVEPVLASFAREEASRALLDGGNLTAALSIIGQLSSPVAPDILLRAAGAARSAGSLDRAVALYTQARANAGRTISADQAALGLAATLEQNGDARGALDVFRQLQLTFRQPSTYDAADAGARRLSAQLGNAEPLTEDDYDAIADRLSGVAAFRRSVNVLTEWRKTFPDSAHTARIDNAIIQNLYSLRANDEARQYAATVMASRGDGPESAAANRTIFSLDVREGKTADVERRGFEILTGQVAGTTLAQRQGAGRQLAEYLVSVGLYRRGLDAYDRLYAITTSRGERIDLLWRMAVGNLRAGNRTKAIAQLRQVRRLKLDSETDRATAYWLGYALNVPATAGEARTLWKDLVDRYPFSYYGVRAAANLSLPLPAPALSFPQLALSEAVAAHPDYRVAVLLARAGLLPEAAFYARRLSSAFRRDEGVALLAARASEAAGEPSSTSTLMSAYFGRFLERPVSGLPDDFWRLAYPSAYWDEVAAAAARHHVDPLLMLALARQESHFDRAARSIVGAIGLFQIMPATAVEIDPSFQVDHAEDQLVRPEVAAELAATLLEQHLARFQGALAPTIASYNADKARVQVWWNIAKGLPEESFVDGIPYRETRGYVRQVLANYALYERYAVRSASPKK